ncbi:MAG: hypothetical protein JXR97_04180, partial [Planctomycetes bacterium]|nr:hypothetical protein [Planctomycetota bacterium]
VLVNYKDDRDNKCRISTAVRNEKTGELAGVIGISAHVTSVPMKNEEELAAQVKAAAGRLSNLISNL